MNDVVASEVKAVVVAVAVVETEMLRLTMSVEHFVLL